MRPAIRTEMIANAAATAPRTSIGSSVFTTALPLLANSGPRRLCRGARERGRAVDAYGPRRRIVPEIENGLGADFGVAGYFISRAHVSYSTAYNRRGRMNGDSRTRLIEFGTEIYERMNLIGQGSRTAAQ